MTDWNEIRENIARATQASAEFKEIGEIMVEAPEEVDIREFVTRMEKLQKELQDILTVISPGSVVVLDELADTFSRIIDGHPTPYRMTPKISSSKS